MVDVFISYKSQRRAAAEHLKKVIESYGFSVWYDFRGLVHGSDFGPQIERELRAAKIVLVLWCELSRESQWVREEADLAKNLGSYVPLYIAPGVEPPLGYRLNQGVSLSEWLGSPRDGLLDPMFDSIEKLVGRSSSINRATLAEIERTWRNHGSPSLLSFPLEKDDAEKLTLRTWQQERQREHAPSSSIKSYADAIPAATLAFRDVQDSDDLDALLRFLEFFPDAPEAARAKDLVRLLQFRAAHQEALSARQAANESSQRANLAEGVARILGRMGDWAKGIKFDSDQEPSDLKSYFMITFLNGVGTAGAGTIVRGWEWDKTENPAFDIVYGWFPPGKSDSEEWTIVDFPRLTFLGSRWDPSWISIATEVRSRCSAELHEQYPIFLDRTSGISS